MYTVHVEGQNTKTEQNFIHGLALIRLSGTEPGTEEDR